MEQAIESTVKRFTVPMLPPSVNHYVIHSNGRHFKSEAAIAFEKSFSLFVCDPIIGHYFRVEIEIYPNFGKRLDIDNYPKTILDQIARCGLLESPKGKKLTDYSILSMEVTMKPYDGDPRLEIAIFNVGEFYCAKNYGKIPTRRKRAG